MKQNNTVVSITGQRAVSRFDLPPALVRLRDTSGRALKMVLGRLFERADDALFELADRAGTNKDQTLYFDAMRELRLQRKTIAASVMQYVSQAFNEIGRFRPRQSEGSLDNVDQSSLSLIAHADLEQQVAIDSLITKLRNRYKDPLQRLSLRVKHLVPGVELADSQVPLSPEVICGGLEKACNDLDMDIRAKLVVLKLFDRLLGNTLGDFYQEANDTLVDAGVLPDAGLTPTAKTQPRPAKPASAPAPPDQEGVTYATFAELSALLQHREGRRQRAEPAVTGESNLDTEQLTALLSEIQASFGQGKGSDAASLDQQLPHALAAVSQGEARVGQIDNDVIHLVSMLFDFILEDRQLHPVMKALIGRLQIPVLKVALRDRDFFARGGHPARKLLNELALSAIGWSEKRPGQRDPLHEKIQAVVDRVLNDFTDNMSLFDELLADFRQFTDQDRRRRDLIEQRVRDAEEGRARQEQANTMAESVIQTLSAGKAVPDSILTMLHDVWVKYLQWVLLREGEDSERWAGAKELTDHLIWSVDPQSVEGSTRHDLLRAAPAIVDDFRQALQEISWDPFATDKAVQGLEKAHTEVCAQLATSPVHRPEPKAVTEAPIADEPGTDQSIVDIPEVQIDARWLEQADSLRVGAWVEVRRDDIWLRCKLAAIIRATEKYIFVNRNGAKVAEYCRTGLASAMAEGNLTLLDDGLIFDRALESIIDHLRSTRKD